MLKVLSLQRLKPRRERSIQKKQRTTKQITGWWLPTATSTAKVPTRR